MSGGPFDAWIGRAESAEDITTAEPLKRLSALLDHAVPPWREDEVPPLAHWLYFLPRARQSEIDADGHARRGHFLPPIGLPRRMWAGSRIEFLRPLSIGAPVLCLSKITSVQDKTGVGGHTVFVGVRREISADSSLAIVEEQDIVFRGADASGTAPGALRRAKEPEHSGITREISLDSTQLFRFSALTFNAHRIHYDRDYASNVEGYPGLVVQGPFTATLLIDHFLRTRPGARISRVAIRASRSLFDAAPIRLCLARDGDRVKLWALDPSGREAMAAQLTVEN